MIRFFLYTLSIACLASCGSILSSVYGVNEIKDFRQEDIDQFYSDINFGNAFYKTIVLDSTEYETYRRLGKDDLTKKDMSQPIQIHYFSNDSLKSFHANCYAKGSLKNLNWNHESRFEEFLPKSALLTHNDYPTLSEIKHLDGYIKDIDPNKTIILVYWTSMMESIANDAINEVLNNLKKFDRENEVELYLLNTDKFFMTL